MTLPVIIATTKEALAAVPMSLSRSLLERRRHALADHPPHRPAQLHQRHPHRRHPASQPHRRRNRARSCSPARCSIKAIAEGDLFAYSLNDQCMALSMHLYYITTQVTSAPEALPYAIAVVLLGAVLLVNATAIVVRALYLRSRKKW